MEAHDRLLSSEPAQERIALILSRGILHEFHKYYDEFKEIMGRSKKRFEERDWTGLQSDADQRLQLYVQAVDGTAAYASDILGSHAHDAAIWHRAQTTYDGLTTDPALGDLARAYFSTVKRRFFADEAQDWPQSRLDVAHHEEFIEDVQSVDRPRGPNEVEALLRVILALYPFDTPFFDLDGDLRQAAALIEDKLSESRAQTVALLKPIFFRNRRAHIIGRLWSLGRFTPFVVVLTHPEEGLRVAEVLLGQEDTSSLFSFTRSQFHVVTAHHRDLMGFLKSIAPQKSPADLYASVGYNNLAKSALLADMFRGLSQDGRQFQRTSGVNGTVMLAFELPGFRFVIKVIRDKFLPRRVETSRDKVKRRYRFVQYAERIGRIVDIFHFHHVRFEREWFEPGLLDELVAYAPSTVVVRGHEVIFNEFYAQRKVVPLDLYFRGEHDPTAVRRVVMDYGFLHKELAQRNIFSGDVVPNNYGVVSVGKTSMRVVSFDYDGYSRVTDMNFIDTSVSTVSDDDDDGDPWSVYDDWGSPEENMVIDEEWDVLPEKFRMTFGVPEPFREEFERVHGELYTARYWRNLQDDLKQRPEWVEAFPYHMIAKTR